MFNYFLMLLSGIFLIFSVVDILLHRNYGIKRSKIGYSFLCCQICASLLTGYLGISSTAARQVNDDSKRYLAVKYLAVGNGGQAQKYINILPEDSDSDKYYKTVLSIVKDDIGGDYSSAVQKAQLLIDTADLNDSKKDKVTNLLNISKKMTETNSGSPDYEPLKRQADQIINSTINELFKNFNISDDIRLRYDAIYTIDEAISKQQFTPENDEIAAGLVRSDKSQDGYKAAVKYYFALGDLKTAEDTAKALVGKYPTVYNKIIYTDVLTQRIRNSLTMQDYSSIPKGEEESKLISKADELENEAKGYDKLISNETNPEKLQRIEGEKGRLLNEASSLKKEALLVPVKRAINYLIDSKPILGDNTGLIDMQIAKLYFAADEIEKSRKYMYKALDSGTGISNGSIIKDDILEIKDALAKSNDSKTPLETQFAPAVDNIVNKMSQNIIPTDKATINQEFKNSVVSELKYSNLQLFISRVDYSKYPDIKAYVNVSGKKDGIFGLANYYKEKDFYLTDTDYKITDFKLARNSSDGGVNIALVMDHSGSMSGRPFEDAKLAVMSCIDNKGSKDSLSVVTYSDDGTIVSGLNNNDDILKSSVNMIGGPDGNTNISDGLFKGFETLSNASGVKAMILLSDGQDNQSEAGSLEKILDYAKTNGILIFTVGLGDIDENYMRNIAEQTGAVFLRAGNTTELYDIYRLLQKYIINNYTFQYKVEKNPDDKVRRCDIVLPGEGVSDTKYYGLEGSTPVDEDTYDAVHQDPNSLLIEGVSPSSLAVSSVGRNTWIKVTGKNFDKKMKVMIGNYDADKVKVVSDTEADVLLPEKLTPDFYSITIQNPDGSRKTKSMAFTLFRPGTAKKLKIGSITVEANTIGRTDDTTFIASGNVIINDFLRSSSDIFISANASNQLDLSGKDVINLGESGYIKGDGKLYVSYMKDDGTKNNFAAMVLSGKDYIVKNGKYSINVNNLEASFDNNELMSLLKIKIPGIMDLTAGEVKITADGIEVKAYDGENLTLLQSFSDGLRGKKQGESFWDGLLETDKDEKKTSISFDELSFKVTREDILVKIDVGLKSGQLKLPGFELKEAGLCIDTISDKDEWVTVKGDMKLKLMNTKDMEFKAEIATYHLIPNRITVVAVMDDGIALDPDRIIRLFEVGGGVNNLAKLSEFQVLVKAKAGIKGSALLGIKDDKVPKLLEKINEIIMLDNMELKIQPVSSVNASAELKVFDTKLAEAEISLSKEGFSVLAKVMFDVGFLGAVIDMQGSQMVNINGQGLFLETRGSINRLKVPIVNIDIRDAEGSLTVSIANYRLMMEAEGARIVFDLNKGAWGLLDPEISISIN